MQPSLLMSLTARRYHEHPITNFKGETRGISTTYFPSCNIIGMCFMLLHVIKNTMDLRIHQ